jgi:type I restriction enzyme S subunit
MRERMKPNEAYKGLGLRSHGKGTFLKEQEDPATNSMDILYEVKREDLIVNITFAWEGAIAVAGSSDDGALVSHRFPTYTFSKDRALPEFFKFEVVDKQFVYKLGLISPGGAGRNRVMSKADFLKLKVLLPSPEEQQKIADCLDSVDVLIAAQERKVEALRTHKKGLMQQLFPQQGETQPRLRFPEFEGAGEWEEKSLGEIIEVASGQVDPTQTPYRSFPQVGSENIESISGKLANVKSASEKGIMSGNHVFDNNDILYSKIRPALNKVAAPDFKGICSADIYPVRPSTDELLRIYLLYLLRSENFLEYAIRISERGKIPKINRDGLLSYRTPIPSPHEQQRIADFFTLLDDLIAAESRKLDLLKTHKKGLMQQLFPPVAKEEA